MKQQRKDLLNVKIFENRSMMGKAAATDISSKIKELLSEKDYVNMIFAAAPSQNDVLEALVENSEIEWDRINAFHMDEYVGLESNAPQSFGRFLCEHIFGKVKFRSVNYINSVSKDESTECLRYGMLLDEYPTDIVVMGIGENGHIAFNDPGVANFNDSETVKVVELDDVCRQQQVNDGCFDKIENVPTHAITLTVPTLFRADYLYCIVPAATKAKAVKETLNAEINEHCPATILRKHDNATLYLDAESAALL